MANIIILTITSLLFLFLFFASLIEYFCRIFRKKKATYYLNHYFWIPMVGSLMFAIISWVAYVQDGSLFVTIVFCALESVCLVLLNVWKNCYIIYDEKSFTHKSFLGMKRMFTYNQVTAWADDSNSSSLSMLCSFYVADKKLSFDISSDDGTDFMFILNSEYINIHNDKMPTIKKRK